MPEKKKKRKLTIDTAPKGEAELIPEEDAEYEEELAQQVINERENADELERKAVKQAADEKLRYEQRLRQEKIAMLLKKQGIEADDSDSEEPEEEQEPAKPLTFKKKLENFWYHYKVPFIIGVAAFALFGYMIYDLIVKVNPDITIISVVDNGLYSRMDDLEDYLELYCEDLNGDGKVVVEIINCPMNETDTSTTAQNYATKLYSTLQSGRTVMVLADDVSMYSVEQVAFENLMLKFPGNEHVTEWGVSLTGDELRSAINWQQMPQDMVLMVRIPVETLSYDKEDMQESCDNALEFIERLINDTKVD